MKSGASIAGPPDVHRDIEGETSTALAALLTLLPEKLRASSAAPNGPFAPKYTLLATSLEFQAGMVADLVANRQFSDASIWDRCVAAFMNIWLEKEQASVFAETVHSHFQAIDQVRCSDLYFFS